MKVVITELMWEQGLQALEDLADIQYDQSLWADRQGLTEAIEEADALIVRNQTKVTAEVIGKAKHLKVIGRLGVGLDNIDINACKDANITVVYAHNANAISVAEYVMNAILNHSRNIIQASKDVKKGTWNRALHTGGEIYGKTLGLIGVGEIAHRIAKRGKAFGMNVIGYDPFRSNYDFAVAETGIQLTSFDNVIQDSEFISIHVPLLPTTRNMFTLDVLKQMKQDSCIINTSRGGIIDEHDLDRALKEEVLSGAFIDVLAEEPPSSNHPLLFNDKVTLSPHIAGLTEESQIRTSMLVANEVAKVLKEETPLHAV